MVTIQSADNALKTLYLGVVAELIDTEKVCFFVRAKCP